MSLEREIAEYENSLYNQDVATSVSGILQNIIEPGKPLKIFFSNLKQPPSSGSALVFYNASNIKDISDVVTPLISEEDKKIMQDLLFSTFKQNFIPSSKLIHYVFSKGESVILLPKLDKLNYYISTKKLLIFSRCMGLDKLVLYGDSKLDQSALKEIDAAYSKIYDTPLEFGVVPFSKEPEPIKIKCPEGFRPIKLRVEKKKFTKLQEKTYLFLSNIQKKYRFCRRNCPGDGDCFYHAVSGVMNIEGGQEEVRKLAVKQLRRHPVKIFDMYLSYFYEEDREKEIEIAMKKTRVLLEYLKENKKCDYDEICIDVVRNKLKELLRDAEFKEKFIKAYKAWRKILLTSGIYVNDVTLDLVIKDLGYGALILNMNRNLITSVQCQLPFGETTSSIKGLLVIVYDGIHYQMGSVVDRGSGKAFSVLDVSCPEQNQIISNTCFHFQ